MCKCVKKKKKDILQYMYNSLWLYKYNFPETTVRTCSVVDKTQNRESGAINTKSNLVGRRQKALI